MSEQELQNVLWMAEELDFQVKPSLIGQAEGLINSFLESAANLAFSHSVYQA
jgi:hypothetical protein